MSNGEVEKGLIDWKQFAVTPSDGSKVILVRAVLWSDDFRKVLVVLNREEPEFNKPRGWGLPGGKVPSPTPDGKIPGKTPLEKAYNEVQGETELVKIDFKMHRIPVNARIDQNGRIHIIFTGKIESYTEIPENPVDPDGDILAAALMDPDHDVIRSGSEILFRRERFYWRHYEYILNARERFPAGELII